MINVTDDTFENEIKSEIPVLVYFWAPWCNPCQFFAPIIEKIAEKYNGKIKIIKLNVDENPKTTTFYTIRGIPTILVFKNSIQTDVIFGIESKEKLENTIKELI